MTPRTTTFARHLHHSWLNKKPSSHPILNQQTKQTHARHRKAPFAIKIALRKWRCGEWSEDEIFRALTEMAEHGLVNRGEGGWIVVSYQGLGEVLGVVS